MRRRPPPSSRPRLAPVLLLSLAPRPTTWGKGTASTSSPIRGDTNSHKLLPLLLLLLLLLRRCIRGGGHYLLTLLLLLLQVLLLLLQILLLLVLVLLLLHGMLLHG